MPGMGSIQRKPRTAASRTVATLALLAIKTSLLAPLARASGGEFDRVCGGAAVNAGAASEAEQRGAYCESASAAYRASRDERTLWKVWAGVASVCAFACVKSFLGPVSSYVCAGANVAGAATDAVVTRQFNSALMALGQFSATQMLSQRAPAAEAATHGAKQQPVKSKPDLSACLSAATATMQAVTKRRSSQISRDAYLGALDQARRLASTAAPLPAGAAAVGVNSRAVVGGEGAAPVGARTTTGRTPRDLPVRKEREDAGAVCANRTMADGLASCAIALDPTLPGFVRDPRFDRDLERATGRPPAEFLPGAGSGGADTLAGVLSGGLTAPAAGKLAEVLRQLENHAGRESSEVASARYRGVGGGAAVGASDAAEPELDLQAMMKGLMDGMMPGQEGAGEPQTGVSAMDFTRDRAMARAPASLDEATSSLFDRVTERYRLKRPSLLGEEGRL
jgi:hypothetical protein